MSTPNTPNKSKPSTQRIIEGLVQRFESSVRRIIREEVEFALQTQQQILEEAVAPRRDSRRPIRESAPHRPLPSKLMSKYAPDFDEYDEDEDYDTAYQRPARAPMREQRRSTRTGLNPVAESVLLQDEHKGFIDGGEDGHGARPIRLDKPEVIEKMDLLFREYDDFLINL